MHTAYQATADQSRVTARVSAFPRSHPEIDIHSINPSKKSRQVSIIQKQCERSRGRPIMDDHHPTMGKTSTPLPTSLRRILLTNLVLSSLHPCLCLTARGVGVGEFGTESLGSFALVFTSHLTPAILHSIGLGRTAANLLCPPTLAFSKSPSVDSTRRFGSLA